MLSLQDVSKYLDDIKVSLTSASSVLNAVKEGCGHGAKRDKGEVI